VICVLARNRELSLYNVGLLYELWLWGLGPHKIGHKKIEQSKSLAMLQTKVRVARISNMVKSND